MNIQSVMITDVKTCAPTDSLATAARLMAERDCGFLPVIGVPDRLVGVITDRDVCLAIANDRRAPVNVPVSDFMTRTVHGCLDTDDAHVALATMKRERVRRLPVVDRDGRLKGVVSIDDLILQESGMPGGLSCEATVDALRAICEHRIALAPAAPSH